MNAFMALRAFALLAGAAIGLAVFFGRQGDRIAAQPAPDTNVSMIAAGGDAEQNWPRWRGPGGQGIAAGSGYPDAWSDTENILWRVGVPGRGNSSPIV
jgi:hypothetical protein